MCFFFACKIPKRISTITCSSSLISFQLRYIMKTSFSHGLCLVASKFIGLSSSPVQLQLNLDLIYEQLDSSCSSSIFSLISTKWRQLGNRSTTSHECSVLPVEVVWIHGGRGKYVCVNSLLCTKLLGLQSFAVLSYMLYT